MKSKPYKKAHKDSSFIDNSNYDSIDFNHIANDIDFVISGEEAKIAFDKIEHPANDRLALKRKILHQAIQTFEKYNQE